MNEEAGFLKALAENPDDDTTPIRNTPHQGPQRDDCATPQMMRIKLVTPCFLGARMRSKRREQLRQTREIEGNQGTPLGIG